MNRYLQDGDSRGVRRVGPTAAPVRPYGHPGEIRLTSGWWLIACPVGLVVLVALATVAGMAAVARVDAAAKPTAWTCATTVPHVEAER